MKNPPKIRSRFFNSLKRGTGEAYLLAKQHPEIDFSREIIRGILKNYAYDGQCEGGREAYLWGLMAFVVKKEEIRKAVLDGLAREEEDTWTLTQLFALAGMYAEKGDEEAKKAVYDRFLNHPIPGSDWAGAEEIIKLDGLEGLIAVAEKFGRFIEKNPDAWQDDSITIQFQEENPQYKVMEILKDRARTNSYIQMYLDAVERGMIDTKKHAVMQQASYSNILEEIYQSFRLSEKRCMELRPHELTLIAKALLEERSNDKKVKLLQVFGSCPFPLDSAFILRLAKGARDSQVKDRALMALEHLKSENIRDFAIERIPSARNPDSYIRLLISNYKEGDHELLYDRVEKTVNEHLLESLASSIIEVYEANKTKGCAKPLEALYMKSNCGICRCSIVRVMMKNGVLSKKIREEIPYDSYLETRGLLSLGTEPDKEF